MLRMDLTLRDDDTAGASRPPHFAAGPLRPDSFSDCPSCWDRLEQTDWQAWLAFECHGTRFGVRVSDPALAGRIARLLPPGSVPAASPCVEILYSLTAPVSDPGARLKHYYLLHQGTEQIARTLSLEDALASLESDLHGQVAARAQDSLFVHAGVVGWQGGAVVIPGRSFSGKTTLTAALVRAGAAYFSDEYAVFDALGQVHPYPKSLSVRGGSGQFLEHRTPKSLGGRTASKPLPVSLILDTHYTPGASWRPRSPSPGAALFTLLENTVQVRGQPQRALDILQKAASGAAAVKSRRGEADAVAAWVLAHASFSLGNDSLKD